MSFLNCTARLGVKTDPRLYHAAKGERGNPDYIMSPSQIINFDRLPSRWLKGWNPPAARAMRWGNIIDTLALTPEIFMERYVVRPESYPAKDGKTKKWNGNSTWCQTWMAEHALNGVGILTCQESIAAAAAVMEIVIPKNGDDTIRRWFDASDKQVMVAGEWKDEDTGLTIPISALLDFVPKADSEFPSCLGDLKTVASGEPQMFARKAFRFGYHIQAAFDLDIFNAATGQKRDTWCFILSESFEPWESTRAMFGMEGEQGNPGFIELGRDAYKRILATYCRCLATGKWPGYNQTDEAVQGWCILRPEPFMAQKALFAPRYEIEDEDIEQEDLEPDDVPTP
jgi:exodeoxyribonuclease VIII